MKLEISSIIIEQTMWQSHIAAESRYEISRDRESFVFEGKSWEYHNSGLARCVYRSDCGKYVIKVPYCDFIDQEDLDRFLNEDWRYADPSIHHNYGEAQAYKECPKEFKNHLAKTELLPNCWVRQEFVEVKSLSGCGADFREIGKREDGSYCIFDYDPLLRDFRFEGFRWERLPQLIERAVNSL